MRPHIVVDIGNTRLKWGLVDQAQGALVRQESLPDDPAAWQRTIDQWRDPSGARPSFAKVSGPLQWVVASVNPERTERLFAWITERGDYFLHLRYSAQLPLKIDLEHPDRVGIDRLLNAVAVASTEKPARGSILIDAGSAVTVDWLSEAHVYCGGSIFPGLDLMAEALNHYTALLPRVSLSLPVPSLPAKSTTAAIQAGIFLAVSGGIREAVRLYSESASVPPRVYFSGGQAPLLALAMGLPAPRATGTPWNECRLWPEQTLVGILNSALALP
jgi:type III pantothenate kinase